MKKILLAALVFLLVDVSRPTPSFSSPLPLSLKSYFSLNDLWLDLAKPKDLSLPPTDKILSPIPRVEIPASDTEVFASHLDTTAQGSNFSLNYEKGRVKSALFFNLSVSRGGAQLLDSEYRMEPRISFLGREIPMSWKGLGPASEIRQAENIYHYVSGQTEIQLTDRTAVRLFYQGSDLREAEEREIQFNISQSAQAGAALSREWNRWLTTEIGYNLNRDSWEDASYSSLIRGYGPSANMVVQLPSVLGHFQGSSVKFFGDMQKQDWIENRELSSQSTFSTAGLEVRWQISRNLRLIPSFNLKTQKDLWQGESSTTDGYQSSLKLEREQKWGKIKLSAGIDTPTEYQRKYSNEKLKFEKGLNLGWGVTLGKRIELNHRYSFYNPYPSKSKGEENPRAMDVHLKYKLGKSENDPSLQAHGGYRTSPLSSKKSSSEAVLDGAFVVEF